LQRARRGSISLTQLDEVGANLIHRLFESSDVAGGQVLRSRRPRDHGNCCGSHEQLTDAA
jgi:hypothetical protein